MKKSLRRGALLASVLDGKTEWGECCGCPVAETIPGESEEMARLAGVCDLSPLPRTGAKGECAETAPPVNTAAINANGEMFCRLGADEILALSAPDGGAPEMGEIMPRPRITIPRRDSHCQIGLCGTRGAEVLARLCAVPPPQAPALLQTRFADIDGLIIPEPRMAAGAFYLLADAGYAEHLWRAVCAAAARLGGGAIGRKQWLLLMREKSKKPAAKK
ncbi:MAG: hypothetical protein ACR2P5_00140 [Gammaproteobacteria bacterium]